MVMVFVAAATFGTMKARTLTIAQRADSVKQVQQKQTQEQTDKKEAPKRAQEDAALAKLIEKKIKEMPKGTKWSVSVRDLNSDRMANVNADDQFEAAGLSNLFLLAPLEGKVGADQWNNRLAGKPASTCVEQMLKATDNKCAEAIASYVNWQSIDGTNRGLGFKNTKMESAKSQQTTSRDVSEVLHRLQTGQMLTDKARRVVFDGLYRQKARDGIYKGCGVDCLVGNKTGESDKVRHDAAVVTHGPAKYIVVIMSSGGSWQQIADITQTIDVAMLP
jgi:beta-lactamase class A